MTNHTLYRFFDSDDAFRIDRLLYSLSETAERLELNDAQLDVLIRLGEIETVYIGRRRLVPTEALTEYVERLKAAS